MIQEVKTNNNMNLLVFADCKLFEISVKMFAFATYKFAKNKYNKFEKIR